MSTWKRTMKTKAPKTTPVNHVPPKSSWRDRIKVHPAADLFPMMSDAELKVMGERIKEKGIAEKIKIRDVGTDHSSVSLELLDGRNRLEAMELVGIQFELGSDFYDPRYFEEVHIFDDEVVDYITALNLHRRHLTAKDRDRLTDELLKADPTKSDNAIAKIVKRDHKTVGAKRRKLERRGEIPHVETRTDTKGRRQPSSKPERQQSAPAATPEQSAADRKALHVAAEGATETVPTVCSLPTAPMIALAPTAPAEAAVPADDAAQLNELPSEQQDGILHLMLKLLVSLDHKHRKKFHKHFTDHAFDGVYIPSCGNRGWASGRYVVDDAVVKLVVAKLLACNGLPACSLVTPVETDTVADGLERRLNAEAAEPKRKRRTKAEIAADEAEQRERLQALHREIAEALANNLTWKDRDLAKLFKVKTRTVAFIRENGAPTTCSTAATDPYADLPPVEYPEHEREDA
jgi:hypothetical protein